MKKSFFIISFVLLALCFLPALSLPFAHHDNARYFDKFYAPASANPDKRDTQYFLAYILGRPLTAEIHQIIYTHVFGIRDLSLVRWLTVFVFAICAGLLANIFLSFGLSDLEALSLSVAIFILPGAQDAVIMFAIQNALAIWAALWAYLVFCRPHKSGPEEIFKASVFFCLMLASMFLYPQWSFFLFVPVLVKYLLAPSKDLSAVYKGILQLMVFFSVTAIFYYFYIKIFVVNNDTSGGSYAFVIDLNFFFWKILKVFTKILPMAFNFWNFYTLPSLGLALMGLTLILLRKRFVLCILMMIWTVSFWLLIRTDLVLHRIFFVVSAMALTIFLIGIRNSLQLHRGIRKSITICIVTIGLLSVHYLTYLNAMNYNIEFAFIKQSLLACRQPFSRIHIVLPESNGKGYNGQPTVDDIFNSKTASYYFPTNTLNLVRAALRNIHVPDSIWIYDCETDQQKCVARMPRGYSLLITHTAKNQPVYYSPGMVLIDMNKLFMVSSFLNAGG